MIESDSVISISDEEINYFEDLAKKFALKSIHPIFEGDFPDGNLSSLPSLMDIAFQIGLAASADTSNEKNNYGVWGKSTTDFGIKPSMVILSSIAETCGGIAMCLHVQGVATNILLKSKNPIPSSILRVGLALQEGIWPPAWNAPGSQTDSNVMLGTTFETKSSSYIINGVKSFVYSMDPVDAYVVFASEKNRWGCFIVSADSKGITRHDVGVRSGLRACQVESVEFRNVEIPEQARIDSKGNAMKLAKLAMFLNWSGISSIATGIAKGAVKAAKKYADERHQGGMLIKNHPVIKSLIASSDASVKSAEAIIMPLTKYSTITDEALIRAASAKLTVTELCSKAVTDSLQVFGGYGYMEDFGMEKRLRDTTVLKSASGSPVYLKQLIFNIEKENTI